MIQGGFVSKHVKFCSLLLMPAFCFHLSVSPLVLERKMKLLVKRKKHKSDQFSFCRSLSLFRYGSDNMSSLPDSAPDMIDPSFLSSPSWLGCNVSFWHLFWKMGIVISHLQMYKGEVLCPYHILLCLIGQVQCLQGSCSKNFKRAFRSRLPSWRWIWQLEHFSSSVSNQCDLWNTWRNFAPSWWICSFLFYH